MTGSVRANTVDARAGRRRGGRRALPRHRAFRDHGPDPRVARLRHRATRSSASSRPTSSATGSTRISSPACPRRPTRSPQSMRAGERIVVFGDFDLDGVSAAAVAARGLRALGADVHAIVPHRFREGYGLSAAAIERLMALRAEARRHRGLRHLRGRRGRAARREGRARRRHRPPRAGRWACRSASRSSTRSSTRRVAPRATSPAAVSRSSSCTPSAVRLGKPIVWRELTDLATLGTVADIVPLSAENRALVADGVARMRDDDPRADRRARRGRGHLAADALVRGASRSRSRRGSTPQAAWPTRSSRSTCS